MSSDILRERLATVGELRAQAQSDDRDAAVAARAALVRMITDDSDEVAAAARRTLAETSISLVPARIDFGPVSPGTPRLSAAISIHGSPMALTSTLKVTGAGLRARIAGNQLQVQWQPGDGPLTGMVSLDGPAGAADLPVTGHIRSGHLDFEAPGAWPGVAELPEVRPDGAEGPRGEPVEAEPRATASAAVAPSGPDLLGSGPVGAWPADDDPWGIEPVGTWPADDETPGPAPHESQPGEAGSPRAGEPTANESRMSEPAGDGFRVGEPAEAEFRTGEPIGDGSGGSEWPGDGFQGIEFPRIGPTGDRAWGSGPTTNDFAEGDGPGGSGPDVRSGRIGSGSLSGLTVVDRRPQFPPGSEAPQKPRRRAKGLIIAGATALALLGGTGLAAAVTLQNDQAAPAKQQKQQEQQQGRDQAGGNQQGREQSGQKGSTGTGSDRTGGGQDDNQAGGDRAARRPSVDRPTVVGTIKVGNEPEGVAVSPDSRTLYVANQNSRVLSVADLQSGQVRQVTLHNTPRFVAVSQDGRRVFVSMYEDDLSGSGVAVVDAARLTVVRNLRTGVQPYALAVAPDGRLWVPIHGGRNVEIYEAEELTGRVFVPENPHAVSFDTDGQRAFTPDHESSTVSVIDTRNDQRLRSIPVSAAPHSLAVSPDGRTVVVACFQADAVDLIDTQTLERRGPFRVGRKPQAAAFATDSGHAYSVNEGSNSVSVIDPATGRVTATVPVGKSPRTMAVAPNGRFAYVSNGDDDTVTILRVS